MIVDTSAIVAILRDEADASWCMRVLANETGARLSAASYLEVTIVVDGTRNPVLSRNLDVLLDALLEEADLTIEPVTANQARIARMAYREFGQGSGHPARLNFGDCFAYALAKETGEPLLFVGNDFAQTDLRPAGDDHRG